MEKLITKDTIRRFAYSNVHLLKEPARGIVVSFFGLGYNRMQDADTEEGIFFAEHGILYLFPYNAPWCWMDREAVLFTDEVIDAMVAGLSLPEDIPVVLMGGSMGGLSALVYSRYAARTPVACVVNCPVCDLPYHYTEREDLPRTLYHAFFFEEGKIGDVLRTASPLHLAPEMPDIPYYVFHCCNDKAVNKQKHSDRFVEAMRASGHRVEYFEVPGRGHCALPYDLHARYLSLCVEAIDRAEE